YQGSSEDKSVPEMKGRGDRRRRTTRPAPVSRLLQVGRRVLDAVGLLDLADYLPVRLVVDGYELRQALELITQGRAREVEREERLLDLRDQVRMEVVDVVVRGRGERAGLVDDANLVRVVKVARGHTLDDLGRHGRRVVVASDHAEDRVVVATREDDLVILTRHDAQPGEQRGRRLVTRVRGRRGVRHDLAGQVGDLLDVGLVAHVHLQRVAEAPGLVAHDRERHGAGQVHRERSGAGGEAGDMKPAGAHGLDLRRV